MGRETATRAVAARFPGLPVCVVPAPESAETILVRPDGYVAGRGGAGDGARLVDLLARALGVSDRGEENTA